MSDIKGIDISSYQAGINISGLKSSGIDFVILKIGEGSSLVDPSFDSFYEKAISSGLKVGAYFYSYATTKEIAIRDANRALSLAKGRSLPLGIYMDVEDPSQLRISDSSLTAVVKAWCDTIRSGGYRPGAYGSDLNLWAKVGPSFLGNDVLIWSACWGSRPHVNADIWQYSDRTTAGGICPVDGDYAISNRMKLLIQNGSLDKDQSEPIPAPNSPIDQSPDYKSCQVTGDLPVLKNGIYDQKPGRTGGLAGGYVELLQQRLISKHFACGGCGADGIFGNGTEQSVKNFQEENNLPITGEVDSVTWTRLLFI